VLPAITLRVKLPVPWSQELTTPPPTLRVRVLLVMVPLPSLQPTPPPLLPEMVLFVIVKRLDVIVAVNRHAATAIG
jgi:hypothetical protein